MKVLIDVTPLFNRIPRGIGTYLMGLISGFIELELQLEVMFGYKLSRLKYPARLSRVPSGFSSPFIYGRFFLYPRKFDIFHSADRFLPRINKPKVLTIHDLLPFYENMDFLSQRARDRMRKKMEEAMDAAPDAIIAVSEFTKGEIARFFPSFVEKTTVIPHGVSKVFKVRDKNEVKRYLEQRGISSPYLLFVGDPEPRKNVTGVLGAFQLVSKKIRDLKLVLVGGRKEDFKGKALEIIRKVQDRVHIIEEADTSFLAYLYCGALIFLFPSFYEGFGLPVLEAMSSGTPVIVSKHPALQWVSSGASYTVDTDSQSIANGIFELLENKRLREELIEKGLRRASEFSWSKTALKTFEVYNKILTG